MGFSRQEYWSGLPFPSPQNRFLLAIYLDSLVCIFQPQSLSLPLPFQPGNFKFVWNVSNSISALFQFQFQFSHSVDSLWPHELQNARPPCPSPTPGVYSNSCPLSQWCHSTISSSVGPLSSCSQFLPASGSLQMSQFFVSGGQSIRVSASTSVLPKKIQDWCPLWWTGWISLQSKGLSRPFSNTTVIQPQKEGNSATCDNMMELEGIVLSEISQTEKDKYCMISFSCVI